MTRSITKCKVHLILCLILKVSPVAELRKEMKLLWHSLHFFLSPTSFIFVFNLKGKTISFRFSVLGRKVGPEERMFGETFSLGIKYEVILIISENIREMWE